MAVENVRDDNENVVTTPPVDGAHEEAIADALSVPGPDTAAPTGTRVYAEVPELEPAEHLKVPPADESRAPYIGATSIHAADTDSSVPRLAKIETVRSTSSKDKGDKEPEAEPASTEIQAPGVITRPLIGLPAYYSLVMIEQPSPEDSGPEATAPGGPPRHPEAPESEDESERPASRVEDETGTSEETEHSDSGTGDRPEASQATAHRPRTEHAAEDPVPPRRAPERPRANEAHKETAYAREHGLHVGVREAVTPADTREFSERQRRNHLDHLPATGFDDKAQLEEARSQLAAIGYPLDNFRTLIHERNERGTEDENTLASWQNGKFRVYDLLEQEIPEMRLATMGHESAHACSPNKGENTVVIWGSAERQEEARQYVEQATNQALATNIHLNGYHKHLMEGYRKTKTEQETLLAAGSISQAEYDQAMQLATYKMREETWAILNEMALTKRNELARVQEAQHRKLEDLNRAAQAQGHNPLGQKVDLVSPTSSRSGEPQASGIDTHMIHLLEGVKDLRDLRDHVTYLKQRFYPNEEHQQKARLRQAA